MNSVLYGELIDLHRSKEPSMVILVPFSRLGFPANTLRPKQEIAIYDMDHKLEGVAIVQKINYPTKEVEVLVLSTTVKPVKIERTNHYVISGTSKRQYRPYATLAIILSLLYLLDLTGYTAFWIHGLTDTALNPDPHGGSFMTSSLAVFLVGQIFGFEGVHFLVQWTWVLLLILPVVVGGLVARHWRLNGDRTTGIVGTAFAGILIGLGTRFALALSVPFLWVINGGNLASEDYASGWGEVVSVLLTGWSGLLFFGFVTISSAIFLARKQF